MLSSPTISQWSHLCEIEVMFIATLPTDGILYDCTKSTTKKMYSDKSKGNGKGKRLLF